MPLYLNTSGITSSRPSPTRGRWSKTGWGVVRRVGRYNKNKSFQLKIENGKIFTVILHFYSHLQPFYSHLQPFYRHLQPFFIVIFSRRLEIQPFDKDKLGPRASLEDDKRYTSRPLYLYTSITTPHPAFGHLLPQGARGKSLTSIHPNLHTSELPLIRPLATFSRKERGDRTRLFNSN